MKVLFISSGKSGDVSVIVRNQGISLVKSGIKVDYFIITSGLWGYISSIPKIRQKYKTGKYDLVHAHYSLSAFSASFAGCFPLVVSLMGSDVYMSFIFRLAVKISIRYRWDATIVKSKKLKETIDFPDAKIIPNGVDLERFILIPKNEARILVNIPLDKKIVLFIANQNRSEKNSKLANDAIKTINNNNIELRYIHNVPNDIIPYFLNAADVLLLTSKWEGSPNVIKEAMACNCPIVATDVGDVGWLIGELEGCYITSFEPIDVANKVKAAISFDKRTTGREKLIALGLDSMTVAKNILTVYNEVLDK